jgi:ankyrin repeat protein
MENGRDRGGHNEANRRNIGFTFGICLLVVVLACIGLGWRAVDKSRTDEQLIVAVKRSDAPAVVRLLRQGADVDTREVESLSNRLENLSNRPQVQWIGPTALQDAVEAVASSPAHAAAIQIVDLLLSRGADPNMAGADGFTPLIEACTHHEEDIVKRLLDHGADVNAATAYYATPLMFAADCNDTGVISILLARGADVHAKDAEGDTALIHAVQQNSAPVVLFLLQHGVDANERGHYGLTGLMITEDPAVLRTLLDHGGDCNARSESGVTPLGFAKIYANPTILRILKRAGAHE